MSTFFLTAALVLWRAHLCESTWNTDYGYAIKYVRSQDKPLVVLFDILSETGGDLDQSAVFRDEKLDRLLSDGYVRLFVDLQTEAGRNLAAEFGVTDYPRLVVVDRSGEWQVYRRSGYHSVDDLVSVLGRYRHTKLVSTTGTNRLTPTTTSQSPSAGPTTSAPLCKT